MNDDQKRDIIEAFATVKAAAELLDAAWKVLAKFGDKVPSINLVAIEMFTEDIKTIEFSMEGIKCFVRVSFLQQIAKPKEMADGS